MAIILGTLEDAFCQGMFPDNFSQKEHCSYAFAFQVDEALHKLIADRRSQAAVTGFFWEWGEAETYQLAGRAGAEPAAMLTSPAVVLAGGGMAYHCPRELPISCFTFWCSSAKLHVGSFSVSLCSAMQTSPRVPKSQDEKLILPFGPDPQQTYAHT